MCVRSERTLTDLGNTVPGMLFLIHAEDKPDSVELRMVTRPTHLEYMAPFDIRVGGPLVNENGDMAGSCLIIEAEDLAAAQSFAENDPYNKAGLFERVSITEFKAITWPGND